MNPAIKPDWRWGTAEGSRDFDRLLDRELTFREVLEWLEEAETLSLHFKEQREREGSTNQAPRG
jgi:hypothetical protein